MTSLQEIQERAEKEMERCLPETGVYGKEFIDNVVATTYSQARKDTIKEMNDCTCKEKWTLGVVHRKDKPCYWPSNDQDSLKSQP